MLRAQSLSRGASNGYLIPWCFIHLTASMAGMAKPSPSHAGDPALVALGAAIRAERSRIGLSQEALAHDVGLDRSYVGGIERGEHNAAVINLLKISRRLGVSLSELVGAAGL